MVLLNNSICNVIGKFKVLIFLYNENMALFACSLKYFLVFANLPLLENMIPKYLYSLTISKCSPL